MRPLPRLVRRSTEEEEKECVSGMRMKSGDEMGKEEEEQKREPEGERVLYAGKGLEGHIKQAPVPPFPSLSPNFLLHPTINSPSVCPAK